MAKGWPPRSDALPSEATDAPAGAGAESAALPPGRPAQLRVPTTREAKTWWDPSYWTVARPTDFCYGDGAWGLEGQPHPLSVIEWITVLLRREELEYSLPSDPEPYEAAKVTPPHFHPRPLPGPWQALGGAISDCKNTREISDPHLPLFLDLHVSSITDFP